MKLKECSLLFTDGNWIESKDQADSGLRLIQTGNVGNGKYLEKAERAKYISEETFVDLKCTEIFPGDILISRLPEPVGRACVIPEKEERMITAVDCTILRVDENIVDKRYLLHFLKSQVYYRNLYSKLAGTTRVRISRKNLEQIEIPISDRITQIKVGNVLDRIEKIIDQRKVQMELLDNLIKSRFVEMFGDPQTNPKGWIKAQMGEYLTTLTDFSANGSYETLDSNVTMYDDPNYALMVRTTDLEKQDFENGVKYIDENAYQLLEKSKVFGNEIIMNKIGSAGKIYLMPCLNRPVSLGRNAFLFRYNKDINPVFMYNLLSTDYGTREIMQHVRGAVTKTITKDATRSVKIIVPPIDLQKQFADFVQQVDKLKVEVQKSLDEMQVLFDSLMQKYFG